MKYTWDVMKETREKILLVVLKFYKEKDFKFTMDDVRKELNISKKTIYKLFDDKEDMLRDLVDYVFDTIKEEEQKILEDDSLSTLEKIKGILGVMPSGYNDIDFSKIYTRKDKYPVAFARLEERLENGWEPTFELIEKGIEEGVIRPVKLAILKSMYESALEDFFRKDVLSKSGFSYTEALNEVVEILIDGITVR